MLNYESNLFRFLNHPKKNLIIIRQVMLKDIKNEWQDSFFRFILVLVGSKGYRQHINRLKVLQNRMYLFSEIKNKLYLEDKDVIEILDNYS